ncbi:T9SS type A sorting domain-containing protein [Chryseobacterium soli]|uniref:T9SS type A sorting domain-containing protein n=1 Tax=Chryseobacterium soli TaxID=445961 RepID=UPI000A035E12|nr:T9SS type A sorting domain-containing protein [Chryseobacterium soli]
MQFNFLSKCSLHLKAAFLLLLLSSLSFAQNRIYAYEQTSDTFGVCLACNVQNPLNAVGDNENDYSTLTMGTVLLGGVSQTLLFPDVTSNTKLVVGIGTNDIPLTVQLLGGVTIETMNGNVSNGDMKYINSSILKLGGDTPNRATIELQPTKPYTGVKIRVSGGVLSLGGGFRIYYAYQEPVTFTAFGTANGQISLSGNVPVEDSQMTITNISGKEIYRSKINSKNIDLSTPIPEGIYILNLQTKENRIYSRKIIIK